jgi:isopentenyl diphosphate isomerase/L-lactate dehydrogenase-like FMN-dependent dehydrogenase
MHESRRRAIQKFAAFLAASPLACAQQEPVYKAEHLPTLDEIVNIYEFEPICRYKIPKQNYDFISGGVESEWTLRRNRSAFEKITFRPRMLVNTWNMDLSTTLFGDKVAFPVLIAPTAAHQLANPKGEIATAAAAASTGTIICLSSNSSVPFDKVAESTKAPKWWQLYAREDEEASLERVLRAVDAGYKAIAFTVDGPYNSHRERLLRDRPLTSAAVPGVSTGVRRKRPATEPQTERHPYGLQYQIVAKFDWRFLDRLVKTAKVPVLVKGILTAEDAKLSVEHGAAGIVVSNHGGRYLEYAPSTIEMLPEIVDAVRGKLTIVIDSGFRRGTDVLKALAIGANAVMVGRPVLWGLGAYGQEGATRALELLRQELALSMGLCGKPNIASIDRSVIRIDAP